MVFFFVQLTQNAVVIHADVVDRNGTAGGREEVIFGSFRGDVTDGDQL